MNYTKIYASLIETKKSLNRKKIKGDGLERHHIIPKSLGGDNSEENKILLTFREHWFAHKLLIEMNRDNSVAKKKMQFALHNMSTDKRKKNRILTSHQYAEAKQAILDAMIGRKDTPETIAKKKQSQKLRWENTSPERRKELGDMTSKSMIGITHTDERKKNVSEGHKKENLSPETLKAYSDAAIKKLKERPELQFNFSSAGGRAQLGKKKSDEAKKKMSLAKKGKPKSELHKKHMGDAKRGKPWTEKRRESFINSKLKK